MSPAADYWFPAKCYGWRWGLPITWQGWLVLAIYFALLVVGIFLFPPHKSLGGFLIYVVLLSGLLISICWLKGEPRRWRWE